jgi:hypothetical protein
VDEAPPLVALAGVPADEAFLLPEPESPEALAPTGLSAFLSPEPESPDPDFSPEPDFSAEPESPEPEESLPLESEPLPAPARLSVR